jgi:hypothetical protein
VVSPLPTEEEGDDQQLAEEEGEGWAKDEEVGEREEDEEERAEQVEEENNDADLTGMYENPADYNSQRWRVVPLEPFEERNPDTKPTRVLEIWQRGVATLPDRPALT